MYNYIEGKIVEKNPAFVVLEVHGIGYGLNISLNTYTRLEKSEKAKLYTHVAFKVENTNPVGIDIFGFFDEKERTLFRYLISVSRVGNSTAMMMLSAMPPDEIYQAITGEDIKRLQTVKGIGAKAAQRIIMELKDKLDKDFPVSDNLSASYNLNKEEALSGLVMLGFNKVQVGKALDKIISKGGENMSVEQLIKEALKIL
ncbi:MAG: Holliday junction branch migration protein RuvA [Bacteroidales bacterium]|nr:Holliday junction branch migration protein RuvA [Bacteroidales bacterium]